MSCADDVIARLDALIEATGFPPSDLEPDVIIAAHQAIAAHRASLIAELSVMASAARGDARLAARFEELASRDRAWMGALGHAVSLVDQRIGAVRRVRSAR